MMRITSMGSTAEIECAWIATIRRYIAFTAGANLLWEMAQLPLYTIWSNGSSGEKVLAVIHCTGGDILIATAVLFGALVVFGNGRWPAERYADVAAAAFVCGIGYTMFSEWLNNDVRGNWAYTDVMPTLPLFGTGISPLAQWIVIPLVAFWWARRPVTARRQPVENVR